MCARAQDRWAVALPLPCSALAEPRAALRCLAAPCGGRAARSTLLAQQHMLPVNESTNCSRGAPRLTAAAAPCGGSQDPNFRSQHEEVELLFESYLNAFSSVQAALETVEYSIDSSERFVAQRLSSQRNGLLRLDVTFTVITAAITLCSFVTGVFGMNLASGLEELVSRSGCVFLRSLPPLPSRVAAAWLPPFALAGGAERSWLTAAARAHALSSRIPPSPSFHAAPAQPLCVLCWRSSSRGHS